MLPHMAESSQADTTVQLTESEVANCKFGSHTLPPCRVCSAQATGFHYGANTCEACKGFFHRSLNKKDDYVCLKTSKCELKPGNRSMCPACRYRRCLEVGMSKSSIKTGRYSYAKRTKDILELKALGKTPISKQPKLETPPELPVVEAETKYRDQKVLNTLTKLSETRNRLMALKIGEIQKQHLSLLHMKEASPDDTRLIKTLNEQSDISVENPIQTSPPIQMSTFRSPLNLNGLISGSSETEVNQEAVKHWVTMISGQSDGIRFAVDYVKAVPGFKDLPLPDQIHLIKYCMVEMWVIARHSMFNVETKKFTSMAGLTIDLSTAVGPDLADVMCMSALQMQKLKLQERVNLVLSAFIVASPDRCTLEARDQVEAIQYHLLDVLLYVLEEIHGESYLMEYAKIISVLSGLREVTEMYLQKTNNLITKVSDMPPLLLEMLSLS